MLVTTLSGDELKGGVAIWKGDALSICSLCLLSDI